MFTGSQSFVPIQAEQEFCLENKIRCSLILHHFAFPPRAFLLGLCWLLRATVIFLCCLIIFMQRDQCRRLCYFLLCRVVRFQLLRVLFCLLWLKYPSCLDLCWIFCLWTSLFEPFGVPLNIPGSDFSRSPLCKAVMWPFLCYFHYQQLFLNNSRVSEHTAELFPHENLSILFFSVMQC